MEWSVLLIKFIDYQVNYTLSQSICLRHLICVSIFVHYSCHNSLYLKAILHLSAMNLHRHLISFLTNILLLLNPGVSDTYQIKLGFFV